jgi:outer membrane protein
MRNPTLHHQNVKGARFRLPCAFHTLLLLSAVVSGCVSDKVSDQTQLTAYQRRLAREGPQTRVSMEEANPSEARGLLMPVAPAEKTLPDLDITTDPNTGKRTVALTLEQAITRTLANSPEIRVVSFDPEIARQEITKAAGAFDPVQFDQITYDDQDSPPNSYYEPGQADKRLFESGIRQRTPLGSEWSASYAFARNWDDLFGRSLSTRYEPMLIFQLKQPLLRDAWSQVNLAGVNIARLEHQVALIGFRDKAESISAEVIATYWRLAQALGNLEIQRELVGQTLETLNKVDGRREIDATDVQLMQARSYAKVRQADLLEFEKQVKDAQDALARLLADPEVNTISELTIVPVTAPESPSQPPEAAKMLDQALETALVCNPAVQEAQIRIKIAEINVEVAQNQRMPRLDLVGSTRAQSLGATSSDAHEQLEDGKYTSYGVGLSFELPLGNRQREAELMRRRMERRKAVAILHSAADQIAIQVKGKARKAQTTLEQVGLQKEASRAAQAQLEALSQSEPIREKLTPEYLMVKLQAQDTYAQTRRAEINALTEFNISLVELARMTGSVLQLHQVDAALTTVSTTAEPEPEPPASEPPASEPPVKRELPDMMPAGFLYSPPAKVR